MSLKALFVKRLFHFNFDARTSRGPMKDKTSWFVKIWEETNPQLFGIGECGPLPGLSPDARPDFEDVLSDCLKKVDTFASADALAQELNTVIPNGFPSLTFGIETALADLANGGQMRIFENNFSKGMPIPINGLVWMGDFDFMLNQIGQKIADGFSCIKLKVGSLDFDKECNLLAHIRNQFSKTDITIRLDANGAFSPSDALLRLDRLAEFDIHSIEQPVNAGLPEMKDICSRSPIPIALDEELIGVEGLHDKTKMIEGLQPGFLVLKPTLHGGFSGCAEWIQLAERSGTGWWVTSALESNIGLNSICQFTANYNLKLAQGLGTGMIYENNIASPLTVSHGTIFKDQQRQWDIGSLGW